MLKENIPKKKNSHILGVQSSCYGNKACLNHLAPYLYTGSTHHLLTPNFRGVFIRLIFFSPAAVAESVEHASRVREIMASNQLSSQTND